MLEFSDVCHFWMLDTIWRFSPCWHHLPFQSCWQWPMSQLNPRRISMKFSSDLSDVNLNSKPAGHLSSESSTGACVWKFRPPMMVDDGQGVLISAPTSKRRTHKTEPTKQRLILRISSKITWVFCLVFALLWLRYSRLMCWCLKVQACKCMMLASFLLILVLVWWCCSFWMFGDLTLCYPIEPTNIYDGTSISTKPSSRWQRQSRQPPKERNPMFTLRSAIDGTKRGAPAFKARFERFCSLWTLFSVPFRA